MTTTSALDSILRLGELDRALFGARRRRTQAQQLAAPQEARAQDARRSLDKLKELAKTLQRDATRLEGEVKSKTAEIEKAQVALNQAKTNEEYQTLLRTIETKKKELGDAETKVLESYEAQEKRAAEQKEVEGRLKVLEGELSEAKKRVAAETAVVDGEIARLEAERKQAAAQVSAEHLGVYQRVLESNRDSATASVENDICSGCGLKVRPEQVSQIRGKQITTCFTCSRILYLRS